MIKKITETLKLIITSLILLFFLSCEKNQDEKKSQCETDNPIEDISWLKEIKNQLDSNNMPSRIIRYKYNGDYVFLIDPCFQCADGLTTIYNCQGDLICEFGGIMGKNTCPDFDSNKSDSTMLLDNSMVSNCDSENPLEELDWLKEIKQNLEISMGMAGWQIIRYQYNGEYVFWIDPCYQCPDGLISVYDCSGSVICEFGGIDGRNTCLDFESEATDSTMLIDNVQH